MPESDQKKVYDLVKSFDTGMLATFGGTNQLHVRPMAVAQLEESMRIWFMTSAQSLKAQDLEANPRAELIFQSGSAYVVLSGAAQLSRSPSKLDEVWKDIYKVWFPKGKADPDIALVSFDPNRAEYWDQTGAQKLKFLFESAKAFLTGEKARDNGEQHKKVAL